LGAFFGPFGAFWARQQVVFEWRKSGFVLQHSKVITL
jgi:hypothetical protein